MANRCPPALLALTLALVAPVAKAHAQDRADVVGTVVDSATGRPLAAAIVAVGRSEVLTDSAGRVRLPGIGPTGTLLTVTELGYAARTLRIPVAAATAPLVVALPPDPVLLQAITVMADRFRARRDASSLTVTAFGRAELMPWSNATVQKFLSDGAGVVSGACPGEDPAFTAAAGFTSAAARDYGGSRPQSFGRMGTGGVLCTWVHGQWVEPSLWIDDRHAFPDELSALKPRELYLVEVYDRGKMIRVYTTWWVAHTADRPLAPLVR